MTKRLMIVNIFLFTLLIMITGCLPGSRKEVITAKPVEMEKQPPAMLLPISILEGRIDGLRNILNSNDLEDEYRRFVLGVLSDYEKIYDAARSNDRQKTVDALFNSLERLDRKIFAEDKKAGQLNNSTVFKEYTAREKEVFDRYLSGDYQGTIGACSELEADFGPDSITPDIGIIYSTSLAKRRLFPDAVKVGTRIINDLEGRPDIVHLRANVIEWLLEMGNRQNAVVIYEKLVESLDERSSIHARVKQEIGTDEKTPPAVEYTETGETPSGTLSPPPSESLETYEWSADLDVMVERGSYDDAKLFLLKRRLRTEDPSELAMIDETLKKVELAEKDKGRIPDETENLEKAIRLIDEEKYDEAISRLDESSMNQREPREETKRLRDLAVEKLINSERNRAAKIFLSAKNTDDPVKKRELLESSKEILKGLIDKYPESSMIEKLQSNLNMVLRELGD